MGKIKTDSGIKLKEINTREDVRAFDYQTKLGMPGSYPFTRGPYKHPASGEACSSGSKVSIS